MSGLAWLNELMVWLGKWFPRLVLVKATHVGVRPEFAPHGMLVHSVDVIQRGWALPLKNLNDWAQHSKAEL